jgi:hypothetical protein
MIANYMLRKPKHSKIEFVAPKEGEEESIESKNVLQYTSRKFSYPAFFV